MKISIKEICGKNTVTRVDGEKINKLIREAWKSESVIELDFGNLVVASVSFMDQSIGLLAEDFSQKDLVSKLRLVNINAADKTLLNEVLISRYKKKKTRL